jgi:putative membrane protein
MRKGFVLLTLFSLIAVGSTTIPAFAAGKGLASGDETFMKEAASGGMMEVQLGQVAQEKGKMQEVKDFGSRMVTDHGKANDELKALATTKNVTLPAQLLPKHKSGVDKLSRAGADFDKKYMQAMVKDHMKDVADFKKATRTVKDADLNAWAVKTLPVLEQHLQQAKDIAQKLGLHVK